MLPEMGNVFILMLMVGSFYGNIFTESAHHNGECTDRNNKVGVCVRLMECKGVMQMLSGSLTLEESQYIKSLLCRVDSSQTNPTRNLFVCCIPELFQISPESLLPKPPQCGLHLSRKIMLGSVADPLEYPWMALIFFKKMNGIIKTNCGGALINPRYVLSAAHCMFVESTFSGAKVHSVRLGEYNLDTEPDGCVDGSCLPLHMDVLIEEVIVHQLYHSNAGNHHHDISLVRLKQSVEYTNYIKPICLPLNPSLREKDYLNVTMDIAGWGTTENRFKSSFKMTGQIKVVPTEKCQENFKRFGYEVTPNQLCAGSDNNVDVCRGDSGGPLMVAENNIYYAAGIVSYGPKPCGLANWPGVYTRVGYYVPWILQNIKP